MPGEAEVNKDSEREIKELIQLASGDFPKTVTFLYSLISKPNMIPSWGLLGGMMNNKENVVFSLRTKDEKEIYILQVILYFNRDDNVVNIHLTGQEPIISRDDEEAVGIIEKFIEGYDTE